jgi:hypothetical protein
LGFDTTGNYSLMYNKGNGVVCIRIKGNAEGSTTMYDEKNITHFTMMELISGAESKLQLKQIHDNVFYRILETNNEIMNLAIKIYSK